MESCDTNILLHAINTSDPLSSKAAAYIRSKQNEESFVLCELVLMELYVGLRNPVVLTNPMSAKAAVEFIQRLRSNRHWRMLDYPGGLMENLWARAAADDFARTRIYDARLALTLRHYGVNRFATRNVKHFQGYGFDEVFDPTV